MFDDAQVDSSSTSEPASSSAPAPSTPDSQAQPDPAQQQQQAPQVPFHQHPRFREITSQNRELRNTVQQLTQRLNQIEQRTQNQGGASQQDQREYLEAAQALRKVMQADPELASMLELTKRFPQLQQGVQGVQELQAQAARARLNEARSHIENLVKDAKLTIDKNYTPHLIRLIAGAAMQLPDGDERYRAGDLSVLTEAFEQIKPFLNALRTPATVATAQTKNQMKQIPPRPAGGTAGQPAPAKLKADASTTDVRQFEANMHDRGKAMLREMFGG